MADSYLLGASAGASFGFTLATLYAGTLLLNLFGLGLFQIVAFLGAVLTVFLVYFMSRVGNKVPITTLLLSGIVVNIFILSLQTVFELRSGKALNGIVAWIAGGFTNITWAQIYIVFPFVLVGTVVAYFFTKDLNMLSMGDDTAQHLGVNTERVRQILLLIGFVDNWSSGFYKWNYWIRRSHYTAYDTTSHWARSQDSSSYIGNCRSNIPHTL